MRVVSVNATRSATIREIRGGTVLALAPSVQINLPNAVGDDYVVTIKSTGAACAIRAQTSGLEIGEGATSGSPLKLTLSTAAVTLLPGEVRQYVWSDSVGGWLLISRSCPPSTVRATSSEWSVEATGDGSTVNYDLPSANTANTIVFVNGAPLDNSAWSVSAGAGTGGVDRLVLASAPTAGHKIKVLAFRKTAV